MMHSSVVASVILLAVSEPGEPLGSRLGPLIDAHHGTVAVALKNLESGEQFRRRADEPMPTASLIKLAVMAEVYVQAAEGKISLDDLTTLTESDKVPGSGVLTSHFSTGVSFPLRDAVRLMIAYSDNTATNLVLDKIGISATAARMEQWGFPHTKIHSKVFRRDTSIFPDRSRQFGLGSTTAGEMIGLLEEIQSGKRFGEKERAAMIGHLKQCQDRDKFSRFLPPGVIVAHKTGSVDHTRTDAGIIFTPRGPVALCVLTTDNEDTTWRTDNAGNLLCANVARVVFDYFNKP